MCLCDGEGRKGGEKELKVQITLQIQTVLVFFFGRIRFYFQMLVYLFLDKMSNHERNQIILLDVLPVKPASDRSGMQANT